MGEALLTVRGLKTCFRRRGREVRAVDGVDLAVWPGQIVCIVGESGSGKSVTGLSIMRLLPKTNCKITGEVNFAGRDLLGLTDSEMTDVRGNHIAIIFQEPMTALNPVLTIGKQMTEVLLRHRRLAKPEATRRAVEMLTFAGMPRAGDALHTYAHQLSGGLRQRVTIAMAMLCEPKLLIADEPTTALDVTIQAQVLELMQRMRHEFHTSIILITHDLSVVAETADHVTVMYAGQVVESVGADELFRQPRHPYTMALMDSIPSIDEEKETLYSIPGMVPDPADMPPGCRFAERCHMAVADCFQGMPELREVGPGHLVRCIVA